MHGRYFGKALGYHTCMDAHTNTHTHPHTHQHTPTHMNMMNVLKYARSKFKSTRISIVNKRMYTYKIIEVYIYDNNAKTY